MKTTALSRLIDEPEAFLKQWPLEPTLWQRPAENLQRLLSIDDVDAILVDQGLRSPSVHLESAGSLVPERNYTMQRFRNELDVGGTVDPLAVAQYQQAGFSLSLHNLQAFHAPLIRFCDRLGYELANPISVTAFLSPPESRALALHHDPLDLFVCQVEGKKLFRLYRPVFREPLKHNRWNSATLDDEASSRLEQGPDLQFELSPGNVLWIPRGWVHDAPAGDSPSLHFTLQVEASTQHWMMEKLLRYLADKAALRSNLPPDFNRGSKQARRAVDRYFDKIEAALAGLDWDDLSRYILTAHRERFSGPRVRPIRDVLMAAQSNMLRGPIFLKAEGAIGAEWIESRLLVDLGNAQRWFMGQQAVLLAEMLESEDEQDIVPEAVRRLGEADGIHFVKSLLASGLAIKGGSGAAN